MNSRASSERKPSEAAALTEEALALLRPGSEAGRFGPTEMEWLASCELVLADTLGETGDAAVLATGARDPSFLEVCESPGLTGQ